MMSSAFRAQHTAVVWEGAPCRCPSPSAAVCSAADLSPAFIRHILEDQLALNESLALYTEQ